VLFALAVRRTERMAASVALDPLGDPLQAVGRRGMTDQARHFFHPWCGRVAPFGSEICAPLRVPLKARDPSAQGVEGVGSNPSGGDEGNPSMRVRSR
jgi:hypothetical protein